MEDFQKKFEAYADIAVKIALNLQKNQKLRITADIEHTDIVRAVTKKAYEAGAKKVYTEFNDPTIERITYEKAPDEGLEEIPEWQIHKLEEIVDDGGAFLKIYTPDPELMNGVDPRRIMLHRRALGEAVNASRYKNAATNGSVNWSMLSVPTKQWAKQVFPGLDEDRQIDALWEQIFNINRINVEDPVAAWNKHLNQLQKKADYLNEHRMTELHYKGPGTDLTVGLADDHVWKVPKFTTQSGIVFLPNVPTEEVFTMPHKDKVNGVVSSTKPLNYDGNLIENFSLTFENGQVVDFHAEKGEHILKSVIETDEGTQRLGEVALVPHDSSISNSNLLFFNTLFDENASCHFALGNALLLNIKDADKYSKEELAQKGYNESMAHIDFMVGSSDLNIDGRTRDGACIPVFRKGNWAF